MVSLEFFQSYEKQGGAKSNLHSTEFLDLTHLSNTAHHFRLSADSVSLVVHCTCVNSKLSLPLLAYSEVPQGLAIRTKSHLFLRDV